MKNEHISLLHIKNKKMLLVLGKGKDIWQVLGAHFKLIFPIAFDEAILTF
jgi:hypothetical protein